MVVGEVLFLCSYVRGLLSSVVDINLGTPIFVFLVSLSTNFAVGH